MNRDFDDALRMTIKDASVIRRPFQTQRARTVRRNALRFTCRDPVGRKRQDKDTGRALARAPDKRQVSAVKRPGRLNVSPANGHSWRRSGDSTPLATVERD